MNIDKFKEANDKFDREFAEKHPDFVKWWAKHPHCDPIEKWRVAPRVAWKAKCYHDEFMEFRQIGSPVSKAFFNNCGHDVKTLILLSMLLTSCADPFFLDLVTVPVQSAVAIQSGGKDAYESYKGETPPTQVLNKRGDR